MSKRGRREEPIRGSVESPRKSNHFVAPSKPHELHSAPSVSNIKKTPSITKGAKICERTYMYDGTTVGLDELPAPVAPRLGPPTNPWRPWPAAIAPMAQGVRTASNARSVTRGEGGHLAVADLAAATRLGTAREPPPALEKAVGGESGRPKNPSAGQREWWFLPSSALLRDLRLLRPLLGRHLNFRSWSSFRTTASYKYTEKYVSQGTIV